MPKVLFSLDLLSAAERRQVASVKSDVLGLGKSYGVVREKMTKIAPKVIALFRLLEPKGVGGFIGFVRLLDPSVPQHADPVDGVDGYRNHRTYMAAVYMQRVVRKLEAPPKDANAVQGKTNPATDQLARVLACVLSVKGIDEDTVWAAVSQEFGILPESGGMKRLQARVERTKPLLDLSAATIKGPAKVIPMRQPAQAQPAAATVMESLGRAAKHVGARNRRIRVAS